MINTIAMWVGFLVIGLGALSLLALIVALACDYSWRRLLKAAPSIYYVNNAIAHYQKVYPPSKWVQDYMGTARHVDPPRTEENV